MPPRVVQSSAVARFLVDEEAATAGPSSITLHSSLEWVTTMTATRIVDPARVRGNLLTDASPDMMRSLLQTMINALLSTDADAVCGAEWGQASADRVAQRNGYRHRPLWADPAE